MRPGGEQSDPALVARKWAKGRSRGESANQSTRRTLKRGKRVPGGGADTAGGDPRLAVGPAAGAGCMKVPVRIGAGGRGNPGPYRDVRQARRTDYSPAPAKGPSAAGSPAAQAHHGRAPASKVPDGGGVSMTCCRLVNESPVGHEISRPERPCYDIC